MLIVIIVICNLHLVSVFASDLKQVVANKGGYTPISNKLMGWKQINWGCNPLTQLNIRFISLFSDKISKLTVFKLNNNLNTVVNTKKTNTSSKKYKTHINLADVPLSDKIISDPESDKLKNDKVKDNEDITENKISPKDSTNVNIENNKDTSEILGETSTEEKVSTKTDEVVESKKLIIGTITYGKPNEKELAKVSNGNFIYDDPKQGITTLTIGKKVFTYGKNTNSKNYFNQPSELVNLINKMPYYTACNNNGVIQIYIPNGEKMTVADGLKIIQEPIGGKDRVLPTKFIIGNSTFTYISDSIAKGNNFNNIESLRNLIDGLNNLNAEIIDNKIIITAEKSSYIGNNIILKVENPGEDCAVNVN